MAVSAASIARGSISYLAVLLPQPAVLLLLLPVIGCTLIAACGVLAELAI